MQKQRRIISNSSIIKQHKLANSIKNKDSALQHLTEEYVAVADLKSILYLSNCPNLNFQFYINLETNLSCI